MSDVSCRAFSWFEASAEAGLVSLEELLVGSPLTLEVLRQPSRRVPWDDWAALCERFSTLVGGDEAVAATGLIIMKADLAGPLVSMAALLADPVDVYRIGFRYVGPLIYKNLKFELTALDSRQLRAQISIPSSNRGSRAWLLMAASTARVLPRFLGAPDSVVLHEALTDRHVSIVITPPPPRSLLRRVKARVAGLVGSEAMVRELEFQQHQLLDTWSALERSERGFRAVLDALPVGIAIHHGGLVRFANPSLRTLLGLPGEAHGVQLEDLAVAADRQPWHALLAGTGEPRAVRLVRPDGKRVDALARGNTRVTFDGEQASLLVLVDRGVEVRALAEAERSERLVHALHEAIPDLVLRLDGDVLVGVHAGAEHPTASELLAPLVGADLGDLIRHFASAITSPDLHEMLATFERARGAHEPTVLRFGASLIGDRCYEARFIPLDGGESVVLVRDVTERTRLEEQLAASERMASVGSLAAGVAHEINNPLMYVEANLTFVIEALAGDGPIDRADLIAALGESLDGTHRVGKIVRQLRDLSRPQAPQPAAIDLAAAASAALELAANTLRHRAVVERRFEPAPRAWADEQHLVQVVVNLLVNAADAIPTGSARDHQIVVRIDTDERGWPRLRVSDSGVGMTPEVLARVFDPFFTTKRASGTGLGLAISHRLVTAARGTLSVESQVGRGSTFSLVLPPAAMAAPVIDLEVNRDARAARSRILIVDDDEAVGRAFVRSLAEHEARWVSSVGEAAALIGGAPFDLILCDVMMPDRSGLELYDLMLTRGLGLEDRIVFVSGGVFVPGDEARLMSTGRPIWLKPMSAEELRTQVARVLRDPH